MKSLLISSVLGLGFAAPAQAADVAIAVDKAEVLACLDAMGATTTWGQCVTQMFAPCEGEAAGSAAHAACLQAEHTDWFETVVGLQDTVMASVTNNARSQVLDLMGFWSTYVDQKCTEVAAAKETGKESARLGCEISEFAGLTGEFAACLEGTSNAEYCELKD